MKNIKIRKCIACTMQRNKNEFIRVIKNKNEDIIIDYSGKLNGRGAYICNKKKCIDKTVKNRLLNRQLKCNVNNNIYEELSTM